MQSKWNDIEIFMVNLTNIFPVLGFWYAVIKFHKCSKNKNIFIYSSLRKFWNSKEFSIMTSINYNKEKLYWCKEDLVLTGSCSWKRFLVHWRPRWCKVVLMTVPVYPDPGQSVVDMFIQNTVRFWNSWAYISPRVCCTVPLDLQHKLLLTGVKSTYFCCRFIHF